VTDPPKLPACWTLEEVYSSRYVLLRSAPPQGYMATIDWQERRIRTGMTTRGAPISDKEYVGRGWRDAMVADAIAHLQSIP